MARGYRTKDEQAERVARYRASGMSVAAFCAEAGIVPATLRRWIARNPEPMRFAEVVTAPQASPRATPAVVVALPNRTRLVVRPGVPVAWVAELARVLG